VERVAALYTAIEAVLGLPAEIAHLRAEVSLLRAEVERLRQSQAPVLVTVKEAAQRLSVTPRTVRRYIEQGKLRSVQFGDTPRVDLGSLPELVEAR
jgi:excisionase family DNA binding protein